MPSRDRDRLRAGAVVAGVVGGLLSGDYGNPDDSSSRVLPADYAFGVWAPIYAGSLVYAADSLPESTGPLRRFWLGEDARDGHRARVATVVHGPEEVVEALGQGLGVALIAAGNAEIYRRPECVVRPVRGLTAAHLAVVWRADDHRPAIRDFVTICVEQAQRAQPMPRRD